MHKIIIFAYIIPSKWEEGGKHSLEKFKTLPAYLRRIKIV